MELLSAFAVSLFLHAPQTASKPPIDDPPFVCDSCEEWNRPQAPFKLHGRSYYVGTLGLGAILIETSGGLILIDGGLPQSASPIAANIRSLGLRVEDIKLILNSHTHYDHAGGIARLQRESGASVAASPSSARALEAGRPTPDDPQFGRDGSEGAFPKVAKVRVRVLKDKENVVLGDTTLTAHFTPGHTPGGTTWTWRSCQGGKCLDIVYADSLNAVSLEGFRFLGGGSAKDLTPVFRRSIDVVATLPCDVFVSVHPGFSDLFDKLKKRETQPAPDPLIDPGACKAYAAGALNRFEARLKAERDGTVK